MNRVLLILLLITCRCLGDGYICVTNGTTVIGAGGGSGGARDGYVCRTNGTTVIGGGGGNTSGDGFVTVIGGTTTVIGATPGPTNTTAGLVNWWRLDENTGTTTADSSDSATGTLNGSPVWISGQINSALAFVNSSYVQLSQNTGFGNHAVTISSWVKNTNNALDGNILFDNDNDASMGFGFATSSAEIEFYVVLPTDLEKFSIVALPLNTWVHVLVTWDGTTTDHTKVHIYTNAVETAYDFGRNGVGTAAANTTTDRFIGNGHGHNSQFPGLIDDPRIWNRVLTTGEITNMYQWRGQP